MHTYKYLSLPVALNEEYLFTNVIGFDNVIVILLLSCNVNIILLGLVGSFATLFTPVATLLIFLFNKIVDGANYYNCNQNNIPTCCKGRKKSCGKLPDGTRLKWKYVDDLTEEEYIKYDIENKIKELEKKELI